MHLSLVAAVWALAAPPAADAVPAIAAPPDVASDSYHDTAVYAVWDRLFQVRQRLEKQRLLPAHEAALLGFLRSHVVAALRDSALFLIVDATPSITHPRGFAGYMRVGDTDLQLLDWSTDMVRRVQAALRSHLAQIAEVDAFIRERSRGDPHRVDFDLDYKYMQAMASPTLSLAAKTELSNRVLLGGAADAPALLRPFAAASIFLTTSAELYKNTPRATRARAIAAIADAAALARWETSFGPAEYVDIPLPAQFPDPQAPVVHVAVASGMLRGRTTDDIQALNTSVYFAHAGDLVRLFPVRDEHAQHELRSTCASLRKTVEGTGVTAVPVRIASRHIPNLSRPVRRSDESVVTYQIVTLEDSIKLEIDRQFGDCAAIVIGYHTFSSDSGDLVNLVLAGRQVEVGSVFQVEMTPGTYSTCRISDELAFSRGWELRICSVLAPRPDAPSHSKFLSPQSLRRLTGLLAVRCAADVDPATGLCKAIDRPEAPGHSSP